MNNEDPESNALVPVTTAVAEKPRCRALTRAGEACGQPAITNYPYCSNHTKFMVTDKSRQYAKTLPPEIKERFEENLDRVDPKDLRPEIAKIRAIASTVDEALNRTIEDAAAQGKPLSTNSLAEYAQLTVTMSEAVRRMAESQARMAPDNVVPLHEVQNMIRRMIVIIRKYVKDPKERETVADEISKACLLEISEQSISYVPGGAVPKNE